MIWCGLTCTKCSMPITMLINLLLLIASSSSSFAASSTTSEDLHHAAMLTRAEASILGECALLDRETGRVFWEGGFSNTLYESLIPKLDQYGAEHAHATVLSAFLMVAFLGVLAGWIGNVLAGQAMMTTTSDWMTTHNKNASAAAVAFVIAILNWTVNRIPKLQNRWLVIASILLYILESYNCQTRRFLTNAITSTNELEAYIDQLRDEKPIVTWSCVTYHFERRKLFALPFMLQNSIRKRLGMIPLSKKCRSMFPLTKKVISHKGKACYQYGRCDDSTIAGVWRRAEATSIKTGLAPFTKIALTKILVLSNKKSREDYFKQQSEFFAQNSRSDELVQFSTHIEVPGYRPRMLAVRSIEGVSSTKTFRLHLFWFFTIMGLTVPYRIWFKKNCDFLRVSIVKETSAPDTVASRKKKKKNGSDTAFQSFMRGRSLYPTDAIVSDTLRKASNSGPT